MAFRDRRRQRALVRGVGVVATCCVQPNLGAVAVSTARLGVPPSDQACPCLVPCCRSSWTWPPQSRSWWRMPWMPGPPPSRCGRCLGDGSGGGQPEVKGKTTQRAAARWHCVAKACTSAACLKYPRNSYPAPAAAATVHAAAPPPPPPPPPPLTPLAPPFIPALPRLRRFGSRSMAPSCWRWRTTGAAWTRRTTRPSPSSTTPPRLATLQTCRWGRQGSGHSAAALGMGPSMPCF